MSTLLPLEENDPLIRGLQFDVLEKVTSSPVPRGEPSLFHSYTLMDGPKAERWENVKQNMFALIIGIDDYSHISKLQGAVADAQRFKSFLINQVKIKNDRIVTLHNKDATRKAIVGAIRDLWGSQTIKRDDPILIFYAGHGCEIPRPKDWEAGGQETIQAICPCDMTLEGSSSKAIHPIPDCTVAVWLDVLSYKKGHNITVILDCCHSAGMTRVPEDGVRAQQYDGKFPRALEEEYAEAIEIDGGVPLSYSHRHSRSHVLLAACSANEQAREINRKGLFTTELLRALEEAGVDQLSFLEFTGRLRHLTMQQKIFQTPQCYGHFKDRVLFSNLLKLGSDVFPVSWDPGARAYRIEAGLIHGIDKGSLFDIYERAAIDTKPLFTLTALDVYPTYTIPAVRKEEFNLSVIPRVARHVCSGNTLKVYFTPAFTSVVDQDSVLHLHDMHRRLTVEHGPGRADIIIDMEAEKTAAFAINTNWHGLRWLPKFAPANPKDVYRVLFSAARWKQHLEILCGSPLAKNIQIEFFRLETSYGDMGLVTKPKGQALNDGSDLVYLDIRPSNNDYYGMKIQNNTTTDLHVSMLAFDSNDLDITSIISGSIGVQSTGSADPKLYAMQFLPIGYGNGGETPLMFKYPCNKVNVTILKLYFTVNPIDLKWLEQPTPFIDMQGDPQDKRGLLTREETWRAVNAMNPIVFTKLFTIVQRAHPY